MTAIAGYHSIILNLCYIASQLMHK